MKNVVILAYSGYNVHFMSFRLTVFLVYWNVVDNSLEHWMIKFINAQLIRKHIS